MIQALDRALRILEFVADRPERDIALGQIARATGLHPATCSHIVKTLTDRGYLEQDAPGRGYRLGPMPFALTRGGAYRRDLAAVAEPYLADLSGRMGESVELSVLRGARRVVVAENEGGGAVAVRAGLVSDRDPFTTASGRLLLAHLGAEALDRLVGRIGLPGEAWGEAAGGRDGLARALEAIRREGWAEILKEGEVVGIASPVFEPRGGVAALGLHLPAYRYEGVHKEEILAAVPKAAADISTELGAQSPGEEREE